MKWKDALTFGWMRNNPEWLCPPPRTRSSRLTADPQLESAACEEMKKREEEIEENMQRESFVWKSVGPVFFIQISKIENLLI